MSSPFIECENCGSPWSTNAANECPGCGQGADGVPPCDDEIGQAVRKWWAQFGPDEEINGGDVVDFLGELLEGSK